jgi:hypothetical protein
VASGAGGAHDRVVAGADGEQGVVQENHRTGDQEDGGRAAMVEEFLAKARELITDRNYDSKSTEHYKVKTDDPRLLVGEVANLMESFRAFFDGFWSERMELHPYEDPARIFLFYSRYKYKQLLSEAEKSTGPKSIGHYRPYFGVVAAHTDTVGPGDLPDLLVHEASHQLVHKRLYGDRSVPSYWVAEGLATYHGYMLREKSGEFVPGRLGGKNVLLLKRVPRSKAEIGRKQLDSFRRQLKLVPIDVIDTLITTQDAAAFYGPGGEDRYTASWLVTHFLLHAEEGAHTPAFVRYMQREARGQGGADAFWEEIAAPPEALESSFREYVKRLKFR